MKNKKMLESLGELDDKYIEEADPGKGGRGKRIRLSVLAACACIAVMSAALWLFIPFRTTPPDVSRYENSEYYDVIKTINEVNYTPPAYDNNMQKLLASLFYAAAENGTSNALGDPTSDSDMPSYVEATDNQVEGVIEADLIKRSDKHIYYMKGETLAVYSIEGEESKLVGQFKLQRVKNSHLIGNAEFYLSSDCKTVTVIRQNRNNNMTVTELISLDVTDPENITEKRNITLSGSYITSRKIDGKLLVISNFTPKKDPDFGNESDYLPQIENTSISADNIILPDSVNTNSYAVVCMLDEATLEEINSYAFYSYYSDAYVSMGSVYLTRPFIDEVSAGDTTTRTQMSEIARLSYSDGLTYIGSVNLPGTVLDQYSLDEYNGILRAATTTNTRDTKETYEDGDLVGFVALKSSVNASLFCVDLEKMKIVASVENFAPEGETVRSARFDGDTAYVCTAIQLTDPVFFFDLSDLNNITYKETGTIEGYSTSLVNFGDGFLLGIGVGDSMSTLKIEVYRESGDTVVPVCKYEVKDASYSEDYKSYFIDRERGFVGLGVSFYNSQSVYTSVYTDNYVLLRFDGESFTELINTSLPGYNAYKRATLADGCFYMFSPEAFEVQRIEN